MMGAPYPVFPVRLVGFQKLHAAFLNESRTRGTLRDRVQEIRVSARFWQMWDSTAVHRSLSTGNRSSCAWSSTPSTVRGRGLWNSTYAKIGQIWGTRHSLRIEISQ